MSIARYLLSLVEGPLKERAIKRLASQQPQHPFNRENWGRSLTDPTGAYEDAVRHFYHTLPQPLRDHRVYFYGTPGKRRGFGEHAFHTLWNGLLNDIKPKSFLEIGVFRGQVISLVALWAKINGQALQVCVISPFSEAGDAVSKYQGGLDYHEDTLKNFAHFQLPVPELVKAYSTDPGAKARIASQTWDLIYIDGNHDYDVARQDWEVCSRAVRPGGLIVLDDSGLSTSYQPPRFASRGHPGPSKLATEIDRKKFVEVLQVGHNRVFEKK
jgi:hypothetical protein